MNSRLVASCEDKQMRSWRSPNSYGIVDDGKGGMRLGNSSNRLSARTLLSYNFRVYYGFYQVAHLTPLLPFE
jgi:hypothetical protein